MSAFNKYLAGSPPGSGEVSRTAKELDTKSQEAYATTTQNGISNNKLPMKLTQALVRGERLAYQTSTRTCLSCFKVNGAASRKMIANRCH